MWTFNCVEVWIIRTTATRLLQSSLCGQEEGGDCGDGAEILDPRVQIELEKLNSSSEVINKPELDLDQARSTFRDLLDDSKCHIDRLQKKIGNSVKKARPYYEAKCEPGFVSLRLKTQLLDSRRQAVIMRPLKRQS